MPDQLFYNTGIYTYFWVLTNRKSEQRRGKIQLIDAREYSVSMRKSLGDKRKMISDDQIRNNSALHRLHRIREGQNLPITKSSAQCASPSKDRCEHDGA